MRNPLLLLSLAAVLAAPGLSQADHCRFGRSRVSFSFHVGGFSPYHRHYVHRHAIPYTRSYCYPSYSTFYRPSYSTYRVYSSYSPSCYYRTYAPSCGVYAPTYIRSYPPLAASPAECFFQ